MAPRFLQGFTAYRRTRPFWAAVFTVLGGIEILVFPLTPISSLVQLGVGAISGVFIGVVLVVLAAFMLYSPPNRTLAGVLVILFSLVSFLTSNLGGLVVGMLLGLVGGGLCLAWTPRQRPPKGGGRRFGGLGRARGRSGSRAAQHDEAVTEELHEPPPPPDTSFDPPDLQPGRPSPNPRRSRLEFRRRSGSLTAITVAALLSGAVVVPGAAAADTPAGDTPAGCLLGIICSSAPPTASTSAPGGNSTGPARTSAAPATGRSRAAAATPTPSATAAPTPTGLLGLPNPLPGLADGLSQAGNSLGLPVPALAPGQLPVIGDLLPQLITPVLPTTPAEAGAVSSGLIGKLTMDTLTVTNFRFLGVVTFPRAGGGTVKALRIVVDSTDIGNLGATLPSPQGTLLVNQTTGAAHASSPVLILDVTKLYIKVFGVLPLEFSFAFPPPPLITIPALSGTDVDIDYVRVSSDLHAPSIAIALGPASSGATTTAPPPDSTSSATTLVSLASLLNLPALLTPYGLTPAQSQQAVAAYKSSGQVPGSTSTQPPASAAAASTPAEAGGSTATPTPTAGSARSSTATSTQAPEPTPAPLLGGLTP